MKIGGIKAREDGKFNLDTRYKNIPIKKKGLTTREQAERYYLEKVREIDGWDPQPKQIEKAETMTRMIELYIGNLKARGMRNTTIKSYNGHLKNYLLKFLVEEKMEKPDQFLVLNVDPVFIQDLMIYFTGKIDNPSTRSNIRNSLLDFFEFCLINGQLKGEQVIYPLKNVVKKAFSKKNVNKEKRDGIKPEIFEKILRAAEQIEKENLERLKDPDDPKRGRLAWFSTWLALSYFCGPRIGESRALQVKDINFNEKTIKISKQASSKEGTGKFEIIPHTKSGIDRVVPLPNVVMDRLNYMIIFGELKPDDWLFLGETIKGETTIRNLFNRCCKMAGIEETINIHRLRHSCASLYINQGKPIALVAQLLGHKSINTTFEYYAHIWDNLTEIREMDDRLEETFKV